MLVLLGFFTGVASLGIGLYIGATYFADNSKSKGKIKLRFYMPGSADLYFYNKLLEEALRDEALMKGGMDLNTAQERNTYNDINKKILGNEYHKTNLDDIIKREISNIDSNVNFDEIKNKLNGFDLDGLHQEEIKDKIDSLIVSSSNLELHKEIPSFNNDKVESAIDRVVDSMKNNVEIENEHKELKLVIDEKTL